jgi:hypothetical protein
MKTTSQEYIKQKAQKGQKNPNSVYWFRHLPIDQAEAWVLYWENQRIKAEMEEMERLR